MDIEQTKLPSFEEERVERLKNLLGLGGSLFSFPLYVVFWVADVIFFPQHKWEFLALRAAIIPFLILSTYFVKRAAGSFKTQLWCTLATLANSIPITVMIAILGDYGTPYYAGLNLVCLGAGFFLPMTHAFFAFNVFLIYAPYLVLGSLHSQAGDFHPFALNVFFVLGTVVIIAVIHIVREQVYRLEYHGRFRLNKEVNSRGRIIEAKTKEAIKLASLTKQFSPQVLHSIQSGALDITKPVHQANICAIFIDIVDSTERLVELNKDVVSQVLTMYMEDTMPVLLKYDITIDKFLGDGVLAFSNDPIEHPDYVERVVAAAMEIRGRIEARQNGYQDLWGKVFAIRIGIATGPANVGFYGHENYTRSYTAIGPVINLASRLLNAAQPNQILLTKSVAEAILASGKAGALGIEFVHLGPMELKGFRTEKIDVYRIAETVTPAETIDNISVCPEGHGILYLDQNARGIFIFKCRVCNYEDGADVVEVTYKSAA